ncbi:sulfite exporter TauE/SafE family protein [bacterium]|nr:MAG: sulfite exporter TauE/SafE family protein [bacterium]
MIIWEGFIIGLLGSLHCIGMCGPIALALPAGTFKSYRFYAGRIIYNLGRTATYATLGAISGIVGKNLALAGMQRRVSITTGVVIILIVLIPQAVRTNMIYKLPFGAFTNKLKESFGALFKKGALSAMFFIGIVNGFLPCGFVYMGLAGALGTGDFARGILYMALFGLGTLPIMFSVSLAGNFINVKIRQRLSRIIPSLAILLAVIFILRGMNLGIKYISPKTDKFPGSDTEMDAGRNHH